MSTVKLNALQEKDILPAPERPSLKTFAGLIVARFKGISNNRQKLWNAYDDASSICNTPRCLWRRHGALLMYARHQQVSCQRILEKYDR